MQTGGFYIQTSCYLVFRSDSQPYSTGCYYLIFCRPPADFYLITVSCMQQDGDVLLYLQSYRGLVNYKVVSRFFYKRVHKFKKHMCASEIRHLYRSYIVSLVSFHSCLRIPVLPSSWLPAEGELCNAQLDRHPDQLWDRGQMHASCFWWSVPALGPRRNKAAALPHQHLWLPQKITKCLEPSRKPQKQLHFCRWHANCCLCLLMLKLRISMISRAELWWELCIWARVWVGVFVCPWKQRLCSDQLLYE